MENNDTSKILFEIGLLRQKLKRLEKLDNALRLHMCKVKKSISEKCNANKKVILEMFKGKYIKDDANNLLLKVENFENDNWTFEASVFYLCGPGIDLRYGGSIRNWIRCPIVNGDVSTISVISENEYDRVKKIVTNIKDYRTL